MPGFLELARHTLVVEASADGCNFIQRGFQKFQCFAQAVTRRQVGTDRGRTQLAEMVQFLGRHCLRDIHQVAQLHHLAIGAANIDVAYVGGLFAILVPQLHDHIILFGAALETGDFATAEQSLQCTTDRLHVTADGGSLVPVHDHLDLRLVQLEVDIESNEPAVGARFIHQPVDDLLKFVIRTAGLDNDFHGLVDRALSQRGRVHRKRNHARYAAIKLAGQFPGDILL